MSTVDEEIKMYGSIPPMNELCGVICEIDFIEVHDSSVQSNFHWQIMKCRLIITVIPEAIASPVRRTDNSIFVITTTEFYNSGRLQEFLGKINLLFGEPNAVTVNDYKDCLMYTIQSRIAPCWYKVGQYFVKGQKFFNSTEKLEAVKLVISIDDRIMKLQLEPINIKIPFVKLEDFYLTELSMAHFLSNPEGHINVTQYGTQWVHVLPSTKRAKVLSVSKSLPADSSFKDYEQLRRHWKNMYGYQLPVEEKQIIYYRVTFPLPQSNIFTYPSSCVTTGLLEHFPCKDRSLTIEHFLSDIITAFPTICGKKFHISEKNEKHIFQQTVYNMNSQNMFNYKATRCSLPRSNASFNQNASYADIVLSQDSDVLGIHAKQIQINVKDAYLAAPKAFSFLNDLDKIHNPEKFTDVHTQPTNKDTTLPVEHKMATDTSQNQNACGPRQENLSKYFQIRKPYSQAKEEVHTFEQASSQSLTLREKLLKTQSVAKESKTDKTVIDVETLAKNNNLGQVTNAMLRAWLKQHSIPHNTHTKKSDLINKVLTHIRHMKVTKLQ